MLARMDADSTLTGTLRHPAHPGCGLWWGEYQSRFFLL
jgi:hypothetical protein